MIAALYVLTGGPYYGLSDVDPWDEARDARLYRGPHRVVAHPPCARWGRYWHGGPSVKVRRIRGDDQGCFQRALQSVQTWGGILEHPEASSAWTAFQIARPPKDGGWVSAGLFQPGLTCCVEQGHYGHPARKATWLYTTHPSPPELIWGPCQGKAHLDQSYHSAQERADNHGHPRHTRIPANTIATTPTPFRDLLLSLAHSLPPSEPSSRD